jgi:1-acyl-sn-glycerol-3-phosphate acyltransferase
MAAQKKKTKTAKRAASKPAKKKAASRKKGAKKKPSRKGAAKKRAAARKSGTRSLLDRLSPRNLVPERLLPAELEEMLPTAALERIGELGLIGYLAEYVQERVESEADIQFDPDFVEEGLPFLSYILRYFDAEVKGFENVPADGPVLMVGNHSGGTLVPDAAVFIGSWYKERGVGKPLCALAFDAVFGLPRYGAVARKAGAMPASAENAKAAFDAGAAVLVYPGGDHDAYRPWTDRNRIDFDGRKGFVKLALRNQVPVIPFVGHGAHESVVVLARGDAMSGLLGFDRLRTTVMPLVWQLPWGVSIPFIPGIPLPVKISMQICPPVDWSRYGPEDADDPVVVNRCYEEITGIMQTELDRLAEEHPHPLMERLRGLLPGGGG